MSEQINTVEEKLARIEEITKEMQTGKQSLAESLKSFEEGVRLIRETNEMLGEAEKQIRILTEGAEEV